jgi:hypothetical protein
MIIPLLSIELRKSASRQIKLTSPLLAMLAVPSPFLERGRRTAGSGGVRLALFAALACQLWRGEGELQVREG